MIREYFDQSAQSSANFIKDDESLITKFCKRLKCGYSPFNYLLPIPQHMTLFSRRDIALIFQQLTEKPKVQVRDFGDSFGIHISVFQSDHHMIDDLRYQKLFWKTIKRDCHTNRFLCKLFCLIFVSSENIHLTLLSRSKGTTKYCPFSFHEEIKPTKTIIIFFVELF